MALLCQDGGHALLRAPNSSPGLTLTPATSQFALHTGTLRLLHPSILLPRPSQSHNPATQAWRPPLPPIHPWASGPINPSQLLQVSAASRPLHPLPPASTRLSRAIRSAPYKPACTHRHDAAGPASSGPARADRDSHGGTLESAAILGVRRRLAHRSAEVRPVVVLPRRMQNCTCITTQDHRRAQVSLYKLAMSLLLLHRPLPTCLLSCPAQAGVVHAYRTTLHTAAAATHTFNGNTCTTPVITRLLYPNRRYVTIAFPPHLQVWWHELGHGREAGESARHYRDVAR